MSRMLGPTLVMGALALVLLAVGLLRGHGEHIAGLRAGATMVIGVLPLWGLLRSRNSVGRAMRGINAAVVGLLLAALYNPVWTYGVKVPMDFVFVLAAYLALDFWKVPPWLVVILGGLIYGFMG